MRPKLITVPGTNEDTDWGFSPDDLWDTGDLEIDDIIDSLAD